MARNIVTPAVFPKTMYIFTFILTKKLNVKIAAKVVKTKIGLKKMSFGRLDRDYYPHENPKAFLIAEEQNRERIKKFN